MTAFGPLALITVFVDPERRALPGTARQEGELAEERCTSVDCAAEDVGGQRGTLDIIRDMGASLESLPLTRIARPTDTPKTENSHVR